MNTPPPQMPAEFEGRPDTYEHPVPAFVEAVYYRDGKLLHSTLREAEPVPVEEEPGWTVQGGQRGQAA